MAVPLRFAVCLCCAASTLLPHLVGASRLTAEIDFRESTESEFSFLEDTGTGTGVDFEFTELPPNATVGAVVCSQNVSNVWLTDRLLNYSLPNLYEALCDEPLMVLVQREILRMQRLETLLGEKKFAKKFPQNYAKRKAWKTAVKGAALTSLSGFSFLPVGEVAQLVESISATGGRTLYELGELWLQKRLQLKENLRRLVDGGGDAQTEVWADVVSGVLWNDYKKIRALWYNSAVNLDQFNLVNADKVTRADKVWRHPAVKVLKLLVSWGLLAGGLIVGGPVFPIVGVTYGIASTVVDSMLTDKLFKHMSERIEFVLTAMAQWEKQLFSAPPAGTSFCDQELCPAGYTCMRHGVFHCLQGLDAPQNSTQCRPVCVRPAAPPGNSSSECTVGTSCESGICEFPTAPTESAAAKMSTSELVQQMTGKCAGLS